MARADALGFADDGVERLDGSHRIQPDRRLARQHDGVHAVINGIRCIADFSARRPRLEPHRLEHLRSDDDRNAGAPGLSRNFLL